MLQTVAVPVRPAHSADGGVDADAAAPAPASPVSDPASAAVRDRIGVLVSGPLPADAEVRPVGERGEWVRAPGAGGGAVLYVHGGGFAHTTPAAERIMAYRLSQATGRPAVRVDYRLAPAHPYPAALHDVLDVWRDVLAAGVSAADVVFFGESAGATLVLSALLELARTEGPLPGAAVAVSPITDFTLSGASLDGPSSGGASSGGASLEGAGVGGAEETRGAEVRGADIISRAVLTAITADYLAGADPRQAPQSPLYGTLSGLPPLLLAVGADEVLLDDARRFGEAADAAGVSVRLDVHAGMPHAFHLSDQGEVLLERLAAWLADPVRTHRVSEPEAGPYALVEGPDGALWHTLVHENAIARRDRSGRIARQQVGTRPTLIAPGPDGALWFTEYGAHRVGRIVPEPEGVAGGLPRAAGGGVADGGVADGGVADGGGVDGGGVVAGDAPDGVQDGPLGRYESVALPTADGGPFGIAAGPDGAMWCTLSAADRIARIAPDGRVTEYPAPGSFPSSLVTGADGALWCTLNQSHAIGRIDVEGRGTAHPLPTAGAAPVGIAAGPDGALWFTEIGAGQIGRITVDGTITEFPLPDRTARPHAIAPGPDGALWFTEWGTGRIGRITTAGDLTHYDLPDASSEPHGITAYDGAVWCALEVGALARVAVPE